MSLAVKIAALALAGACGTLSRYFLASWVQNLAGPDFPWSTWGVNILGCFLFGLVWMLCEERAYFSTEIRFIILVGFMGAFTTFSTYVFETIQLGRDAEWFRLAANLAGQNILGFAGLLAGMALGRGL